MTTEQMIFARAIRDKCLEYKMAYKELARSSGVDCSLISKYFLGKRQMSDDNIGRLTKTLNMDPEFKYIVRQYSSDDLPVGCVTL